MTLRPIISICGATLLANALTTASPLVYHAQEFRVQLAAKVLPYWFDTAIDRTNGGYVLADDLSGRGVATEKQLVTQARMVWGFSHAHRKGFSTFQRDYLQAAQGGYRFLLDHFLDRAHGGYCWKTDLAGNVLDDRKLLYGESFVIYAFVEYYRASHDAEALRRALELYQVIQQHAHDAKHTGWLEHFQRDWTPLPLRAPNAEVEIAGLKSANTHLHLMEALTELYAASRDRAVRKSLEEAVHINATYFYPPAPGQSSFHREPDWQPVTDPASAGLSYGHNVEFAWLLIRVEKTLGHRPSWRHFYAEINHALKYGDDHERGGLYSRGFDDQPAANTDKVWWAEAEWIAALTDALQHKKDPAYAHALDQQIHFLAAYQINPADGIWLDTVTADGRPKATGKAHNWKANYHDVRAMVKFMEAFAPPGRPPK